jgi:hypothetical protein
MPAAAEAIASYKNVRWKRGFRAKTYAAKLRRFIQQAELYLIKPQNAHFALIEM